MLFSGVESGTPKGMGFSMNLRIGDPKELVGFLHEVVFPLDPFIVGDTCSVVQVGSRLFWRRVHPTTEVGGPFRSLEDLVRPEGTRRYPVEEEVRPPFEVFEWDGWFYRILGGSVERHSTLELAVESGIDIHLSGSTR